MGRIFVFSDVHANLQALEAVLAQTRHEDNVYCLGDIVAYGYKPKESLRRLLEWDGIGMVQGNHDREVVDIYYGRKIAPDRHIAWTVDQLDKEDIDFLDRLPRTLRLEGEWGICHLEHGHGTGRIGPDTPVQTLAEYYPVDDVDSVVYGHSHCADVRRVKECLFVSPGSVSCARDNIPWPGYAVWDEHGWSIHRVAYDIERAIEQLHEACDAVLAPREMDRWVRRFRTGREEPRV